MPKKPTSVPPMSLIPDGAPVTDPAILLFEQKLLKEAFALISFLKVQQQERSQRVEA